MAITISRGQQNMGYYTSVDREFHGGSNGMSCAALIRKFKKPGVFFIFNNGFLAITISRDDKNRSRIPQSIENFDPVIPICMILH